MLDEAAKNRPHLPRTRFRTDRGSIAVAPATGPSHLHDDQRWQRPSVLIAAPPNFRIARGSSRFTDPLRTGSPGCRTQSSRSDRRHWAGIVAEISLGLAAVPLCPVIAAALLAGAGWATGAVGLPLPCKSGAAQRPQSVSRAWQPRPSREISGTPRAKVNDLTLERAHFAPAIAAQRRQEDGRGATSYPGRD